MKHTIISTTSGPTNVDTSTMSRRFPARDSTTTGTEPISMSSRILPPIRHRQRRYAHFRQERRSTRARRQSRSQWTPFSITGMRRSRQRGRNRPLRRLQQGRQDHQQMQGKRQQRQKQRQERRHLFPHPARRLPQQERRP